MIVKLYIYIDKYINSELSLFDFYSNFYSELRQFKVSQNTQTFTGLVFTLILLYHICGGPKSMQYPAKFFEIVRTRTDKIFHTSFFEAKDFSYF